MLAFCVCRGTKMRESLFTNNDIVACCFAGCCARREEGFSCKGWLHWLPHKSGAEYFLWVVLSILYLTCSCSKHCILQFYVLRLCLAEFSKYDFIFYFYFTRLDFSIIGLGNWTRQGVIGLAGDWVGFIVAKA